MFLLKRKKKKKSKKRPKKLRSKYITAYYKLPRGKHFLFHVSSSKKGDTCKVAPYLVKDDYNVCSSLNLLSKFFLNQFVTTNRAESTFNSFGSAHITSRGRKKEIDWRFDIKLWVYYRNLNINRTMMDNKYAIPKLIENKSRKMATRKKIGIKALSILKIPVNF